MTGRVCGGLLAFLILGLASSCGDQATPSPAEPGEPRAESGDPWNLLLIAVDTLRADHLGVYGYGRPTSPAIDRLMARSVVFEEAHASSSWTLPSFATLLTSLHSSTHGCWTFDSNLDPSFTTLAEMLAGSGYRTAGVVSHVFLGEPYGLAQGFEVYDSALVHATLRDSHRAISSPEVTRSAIREMERLASEDAQDPWFLFVHYFDPHKGYREHDGLGHGMGVGDAVDRYDGEIAFTDAAIGELLDRLGSLGAGQRTVVAFVADHGEEFEEHGGFEHGTTLYQEVVHVPLGLRVPGYAARRVSEPVGLVDFTPTVLDLLGIPTGDLPLAGRSLVPLMRGEASDPGSASTGAALMELRFERGSTSGRVDALVVGDWKLVRESTVEGEVVRTQLFDRRNDPGDLRDVAKEHPERVEELTARLQDEVRQARSLADRFDQSAALELDDEELERLRQLGYVGDGGEPVSDPESVDTGHRDQR